MTNSPAKQRAFTLIELLTVIAIIGVLAGLLFPAIKSALQKAEIAQAQNDVKNIEAALKAFYTEYGKWPNTWPNASINDVSYGAIGSSSSYQPSLNNGYFANYWLMNVLRAIPDNGSLSCGNGGTLGSLLTTPINSRGIVFLTVPPKSLKVVNANGNPNKYPDYVDPWGNPYQITVDTSYDGICSNLAGSAFTIVPTPVYNFVANEPGCVTNSVAVWSFGPLGPYAPSHTAKDWITSW